MCISDLNVIIFPDNTICNEAALELVMLHRLFSTDLLFGSIILIIALDKTDWEIYELISGFQEMCKLV